MCLLPSDGVLCPGVSYGVVVPDLELPPDGDPGLEPGGLPVMIYGALEPPTGVLPGGDGDLSGGTVASVALYCSSPVVPDTVDPGSVPENRIFRVENSSFKHFSRFRPFFRKHT